MGEHMDGFFRGFNECGSYFIDKVNFLNKHSGESMTNNGIIFKFHVKFHRIHGEVPTQNFKVSEAFMGIVVYDVTTFRQNLN